MNEWNLPHRMRLHGVDIDVPARRWIWRGLSRSPDVFVVSMIPLPESDESEAVSIKVIPGRDATEEQLFASDSRLVPSRAMTAAALGIVPGVFIGAITRRVLSAIGAHRDKGVLQVVLIGVVCILKVLECAHVSAASLEHDFAL